jgi:hypothetical protein
MAPNNINNNGTNDNIGFIESLKKTVTDAVGFVQEKMAPGDQRPEYQKELSKQLESLEQQVAKATKEGTQQATSTVKNVKDFLSKELKEEDKDNDEAYAAELKEKVTEMSEQLHAQDKSLVQYGRDLTIGGLTNVEGVLDQAKNMISGEQKMEEDNKMLDCAKELTVGGITNVKAGTGSIKNYVSGEEDICKDMQFQVDRIQKRLKHISEEAKESAGKTKAKASEKKDAAVKDAKTKCREAQDFLSGQFDKEKDSSIAKALNEKVIKAHTQLEEACVASSSKKDEENNLGDRAREMTISGLGVIENGAKGTKTTLSGGANK